MATLTIDLDDQVVRRVEESARREHKSVSEWIKERITGAERASTLAAMEAQAVANGYPPNWLMLFGSLADDETFVSPSRSKVRSIDSLD
jgi:hypothetical protein